MAANGVGLVITAWVPLYFSFFSLLGGPPEWHARSGWFCEEAAHMEWRNPLGYVFAAARKVKSPVSLTGRRQTHETQKGSWIFLPFSRLKYRLFGWTPVDRIVAGINMDAVYLLAGSPRADVPRVIQATMDDLVVLFFRWFDEKDLVWPLQREVTKNALFREHYRYARQFLHEVSTLELQAPASESKVVLSVQDYRRLSAAQMRLHKWFFDGNTFVKRVRGGVKTDYLTEDDVDFMRGLPLSVLRIARGVFAPTMPVSVARLSEELKMRNITTATQLLEETNFIDCFALFDLFDEAYTQVDVLREFHRNWVNEGIANLPQQSLPPGQWTGAQNLTALIASPRTSPAEFPKCSTLKCFMHLKWSSTPTRFIKVEKQDVNSLKLLLVGNTGVGKPSRRENDAWVEKFKRFLGFNELQQTAAALKDWHAREKADAVLGLGSILGIPSPTSVRSERFETKWYNVFVKDGGLNIPWLMTVGEEEGLLSPATPIRYHYTLQQPNWYMPNDMYTVVFQFQADMTLENGAVQRDVFNVTVVNLNTWALLTGNPITNNLQTQSSRMMWISRQLFAAAKRNSTWLIVMGHHPVVSTGVEGKQARMQYLEDIYTGNHYRGWEHLAMHHLFFHYQIDAYISGHDYLMEYNTMEDLDNNTTISFINSGAAARLMDRSIGRGWIGRLRGALYPVLCFTGRRVLFLADPGGCEPRGAEKGDALGWFGPKFGNYKINFLERAIQATGFTSLQLTKDHMIVEFIDGRTKKPATRRLQRRSNKAARDITFANPVEVGRKKYEEVQQKREEFARANLELLRKEIYFAKRCPVLAERITSYTREINNMVDRYEKIKREIENFRKMTETQMEEAGMGMDWDMEVERATAEMRAVFVYYKALKKKYVDLLAIKDTLPKRDDPRYQELLQHEKTLMNLKRKSLSLVRQQELDAGEVGEPYSSVQQQVVALSATIDKLEKSIKTAPIPETSQKNGKRELQQAPADSKELLVARLRDTEEELRQVLKTLRAAPQGDPDMSFDRAVKVKQQLERKLRDLRAQLSTYLKPSHPSLVWQKQQELHLVKVKLGHMTNYLLRMERRTPPPADTAKNASAVEEVRSQIRELQVQVQNLEEFLEFRQVTPLQQQFLEKKAALATAELVEAQGTHLQAEEKDVQRVKDSLSLATEVKRRLRSELEQLEQQVKEELQQASTEWEKQHEGQLRNNQEQGTARGQEGKDEADTSTGTALGEEGKGEADTSTGRVGMGVANMGASQGARGRDMAAKTSPQIGRRRLSEKRPVGDAEGSDKALGRENSPELWREGEEKPRRNAHPHTVRAPSEAVPERLHKLSVSQSVKASAEDTRTPQRKPAETGKLSGNSLQRSVEHLSRIAERSRTQPGNHGKPAAKQSKEPGSSTDSSKRLSQASVERPFHTGDKTEAAEAEKNIRSQGTKEKAGDSGKARRETPGAKRKPRKKKASAANEGEKPEANRVPRKKKDPKAQEKGPASLEAAEVQDAAPLEDEYEEEELSKVEVGPLDPCHLVPILEVMVRRALNPGGNAESDKQCENTFADRALNRQLIVLSDKQLLSRGPEGLGASVHPVPSVHISRGWRLYFQDTPKIMFKALMRDLKAGLSFVEKTFKRSTEAAALRQKAQNHQQKPTQTSYNTAQLSGEKTFEGRADGSKGAASEDAESQHQRAVSRSSEKPPSIVADSTAQQHSESTEVHNKVSKTKKAPPGGPEADSQGEQSHGQHFATRPSIALKQPTTDGKLIGSAAEVLETVDPSGASGDRK